MSPTTMRLKLFADGADLDSILRLAGDPRIRGFTTNPTLMRRAGVTDYRAFARAVLEAVRDRPVSLEVFADDAAEMRRQALELAGLAENVYVKIPVTDTSGAPSDELLRDLSNADVKLNVTAVLTLEQVVAVSACLAGRAPAVISVFAGRIADTGRDPVPLVRAAAAICHACSPPIELLWASPRELLNVVQAEEAGCDILTATPDILAKLPLLGTDLAVLSLETVRMFRRDALAAGYVL